MEKLIKKIGEEIASVDSHYINAIGEGGTVAEQIVRRNLKEFIDKLSTIKRWVATIRGVDEYVVRDKDLQELLKE